MFLFSDVESLLYVSPTLYSVFTFMTHTFIKSHIISCFIQNQKLTKSYVINENEEINLILT